MVGDHTLRDVFDADEELSTTEVADRVGGDVSPQDLYLALDSNPELVKVRDGETVRWRLVDDDRSDMPCPLGCGFRPKTGREAARHLLGHALGTHTTGEEQLETQA